MMSGRQVGMQAWGLEARSELETLIWGAPVCVLELRSMVRSGERDMACYVTPYFVSSNHMSPSSSLSPDDLVFYST